MTAQLRLLKRHPAQRGRRRRHSTIESGSGAKAGVKVSCGAHWRLAKVCRRVGILACKSPLSSAAHDHLVRPHYAGHSLDIDHQSVA